MSPVSSRRRRLGGLVLGAVTATSAVAFTAPSGMAADPPPEDSLLAPRVIGAGCPQGQGALQVVDFTGLGVNDVRLGCAQPSGTGVSPVAALDAGGFAVGTEGEGDAQRVCQINGFPAKPCDGGRWVRTVAAHRDAAGAAWVADPGAPGRVLSAEELTGTTFGYAWVPDGKDPVQPRITPGDASKHVVTEGGICTREEGVNYAIDWGSVSQDRVELGCATQLDGMWEDLEHRNQGVYAHDLLKATGKHSVKTCKVPARFTPEPPYWWAWLFLDKKPEEIPPAPAEWVCQIDGLPQGGCDDDAGHWESSQIGIYYGETKVMSGRPAWPVADLNEANDFHYVEPHEDVSSAVGFRWVVNDRLSEDGTNPELNGPRIDTKELFAWRPRAPEVDTGRPADPAPTTPTTPPTTPPGGDPTTPPPGGDPATPPPGGDPSTPPPGGDPTTPPAGGASPVPVGQARARAASWMARELRQGKPAYRLNRPAGDAPDWGLTADMVLGLSAAGGYPETVARTVDAIDTGASRYVDFGGGQVNASGAAKLLTVAAVAKKDPHTFVVKPGGGRFDLVSVVSERVSATGGPKGALVESNGTVANAFGQSYAIIGLSRTTAAGDGARQKMSDATAFLVRQQCPAGNVQLLQTEAGCSASTPVDIDTTAMAAQAFYAADKAGVPGAGAAHARAVAWLRSVQKPSGGFVGAPDFTPTQNSNSTGLAVVALTSGGATVEAARAASWVSGVQAQCTTPGLGGDVGVVAYNAEAFAKGQAEGMGATDRARDAWRRASAQAVFAFAPIMLADLTLATGQDTALATCEATVPPTGDNDDTGDNGGNTGGDGGTGDGDTGGDDGIGGGGGGIGGGNGGNGPGIGGVDPYGHAPAPRQPQQIDTGDTGGYQDQSDLATTGVHAAAVLVAALALIGIGTGFVLARRHRND